MFHGTRCSVARPSGGIEPICEFRNPEDIVATPSGDWLLVSQMAEANGHLAGSIAAYRTGQRPGRGAVPGGRVRRRARLGRRRLRRRRRSKQFAPHGIDLEQRPDGALQLLVINHGGRESVEYLQVEQSDDGLALHWRGCVIAPDDAFFNDLVARRDGGFWATDMMPKNRQFCVGV